MKMKRKLYWVVADSRGTAYLSTARLTKGKAIAAWLEDVYTEDEGENHPWRWWHRVAKYNCQKVWITVEDYNE